MLPTLAPTDWTAISALWQYSNDGRSAATYSPDRKRCYNSNSKELEERNEFQIQCEVIRGEAKRVASSGWRGNFGRDAIYNLCSLKQD